MTLNIAPSIEVPADAWVDWDAVNQKFITAGEKFTPRPQTAKYQESPSTYPADLWTTVKWHDGSPITMGDFVMGMIMTFDHRQAGKRHLRCRSGETLAAFMAHFKGVKIVSTDPLVIETYDDLYSLDAENDGRRPGGRTTLTARAPGTTLAIGVRAEADRQAGFLG